MPRPYLYQSSTRIRRTTIGNPFRGYSRRWYMWRLLAPNTANNVDYVRFREFRNAVSESPDITLSGETPSSFITHCHTQGYIRLTEGLSEREIPRPTFDSDHRQSRYSRRYGFAQQSRPTPQPHVSRPYTRPSFETPPAPPAHVPAGERTFGIEIECLIPNTYNYDKVVEMLRAVGLQAMTQFSHLTSSLTHWVVKHDGSVTGNGMSCELASPILWGEDGREQVKKVCEVLDTITATINQTCGLHVHIGVHDKDMDFFKRLTRLYMKYQPVIDTFMPRSRRGSRGVCGGNYVTVNEDGFIHARNVRDLLNSINQGATGKYHKINYTNYWSRGTIEFRHHSGTMNSEKIMNWVDLIKAMVAKASTNADVNLADATLPGFLSFVEANANLNSYYSRRAILLGSTSGTEA